MPWFRDRKRSLMEMIFILMSGKWFSSLPPARDVLTKAKDCRLLLLLGHLSSSAVSSPSLWNVDSRIIDCLHARSRLGEIVWQIQIQLRAVSQWFIYDLLHNSSWRVLVAGSLLRPCMHLLISIYGRTSFLHCMPLTSFACHPSVQHGAGHSVERLTHNWTYWKESSHNQKFEWVPTFVNI